MKISRIITTLIIAMMAIFAFLSQPEKAVAVPRLYDWFANNTNVYTSNSLLYLLDNLDPTTEYTMQVQEMNLDGTVLRTLKTIVLPTATTTSFIVIPSEWPVGFGPTLDRNYAPVRVIDQFGQRLGWHWISFPCHADWASFSDMVALADVCRNDDAAVAGFFHDKTNPDASTFDPTYPEQTFIHYRTATSTTDRVHIWNLETDVLRQDFDLSAFIDYQENAYTCNVGSCSANALGVDGSNGFVALSLTGTRPPAIDVGAEFRAYTNPGKDNPSTFNIGGFGAYDYHIRNNTDTTTVNGGQSTFIYSQRAADASEWAISLKNSTVQPSENQTVFLNTTTENVGNAYTSHLLEDSVSGTVDTGSYSYQSTRTVVYAVDSVEATGITLTWTVGPEDLNVVGIDPTLYDFEIESSAYSIVAAAVLPPFKERQRDWKTALGLDTIFGSTVLLTFFWFLGFKASNAVGHGNHILQVAVFALIGIGYWLVFDMPILIKILFAISTVFLAIMVISNPQKEMAR